MEKQKKVYVKPIITKQKTGFVGKFGKAGLHSVLEKIDGVDIEELVEKFGSPLFVISEKTIRATQRKALRIFKTRYPKVQFAWSYKTNYLNAVCLVFHEEGSWAEVVSEFEYDKAKLLGVPGNKIIYNGPHKSKSSLIKAINDEAFIHIDHFDELFSLIELTEEIKKTAKVAVRVNMDTGIYPKWDRFGLNYENGEAYEAIRRIMLSDKLNLVGLHCHIGTYILSTDAFKIAAYKLTDLYKRVKYEFNHQLDYIDIGGGIPSKNTLYSYYLDASVSIPSLEDYADAITSGIIEHGLKSDELPLLILESGRALIDEAGYLITTVVANKRLSNGKQAIIVDAGVNLLFTSFWYKHKISTTEFYGEVRDESVIYGNLCMNIDVLRDGVFLPPVPVGKQIIFHNVGAYNMTQWMQFINLRPNVVMIMEDGSVEVIRKAETLNTINELERIPEKLLKK
ncbi:MAG: diaminopimelate decarboxylase [Ignavibacteria bacterium]|nr:diaminopimelate decarboxylase [Ignavibacteria bacterium]